MINRSGSGSWLFSATLIAVVLASILAKIYVALYYQINWDEFLFLSRIYLSSNDSLGSVFQTGYVHLFSWLIWIPGDEVDQVVVGRLIMLLLQCGTMWIIFLIARDLLGWSAALISVASYATFSFVLIHGSSFRADPLVGFLVMCALYWLYFKCVSVKQIFVVSVFLSAATMVSVKSVLLMPMLALVVLVKSIGGGKSFKTIFVYSVPVVGLLCLTFISIYIMHYNFLGGERSGVPINQTFGRFMYVLTPEKIFPRWDFIRQTIIENPFYYMMVFAGVVAAFVSLAKSYKGFDSRALLVLVMATPLLTLIVYRNAFPYYFPYMLPSVSISAGYAWYVLSSANMRSEKIAAFGCLLIFLSALLWMEQHVLMLLAPYTLPVVVILGVYLWLAVKLKASPGVMQVIPLALVLASSFHIYRDGIDRASALTFDDQKKILSVVHKMFPDPVPYLDGNSMVASFPKVGFLMSTWGLARYFSDGVPVISQEVHSREPKFVILNTSTAVLERVFTRESGLLPKDVKVLRENYIPHWGSIYIAGKQLHLEPGRKNTFELIISGRYTLESPIPVLINGKLVEPGEVVELASELVAVQSKHGHVDLVLRYGDNIYRPQGSDREIRPYRGF